MIKLEHFQTPFRYCKVKFVIYLYAIFINVENVSRCVRKVIFVSTFSSMLKSVQHCSGPFFELQLQLGFQQSYFAVLVSTLKSSESAISLASLYAVCLCGATPAVRGA
jgi:hypothetical protein